MSGSSREYQTKWSLENKEHLTSYKASYYQNNKERMREVNRQWGLNNPEKRKAARRKTRLKTEYNITPEEYNLMFESQQGCCAICGKHQQKFKRHLDVDHCHITGRVRKLLCVTCNTDLGVYENRKEEFEKYLGTVDKEIVNE